MPLLDYSVVIHNDVVVVLEGSFARDLTQLT